MSNMFKQFKFTHLGNYDYYSAIVKMETLPDRGLINIKKSKDGMKNKPPFEI